MDTRTSPLLLPVALAQGMLVRLRTPRLPPAKGVSGTVAAPASGNGASAAAGPPLRLLAVGDSIIAGVGCLMQEQALTGQLAAALAARLRRTVEWHAAGVNGVTARSALRLVPGSRFDADLCLVSVGVNDVVRGSSPARFGTALAALVNVLIERSPGAAVIFAGVPPFGSFPAVPAWPLGQLLSVRAARLQLAAQDLAARDTAAGRLHCFDLPPQLAAETISADGFHPGPRGCAIWAAGLVGLAELALGRLERQSACANER